MSEKEILQDLNEIFLHLTDQEPTPDEEIQAREELIEKFEALKDLNAFPLQSHIIEEILEKLRNWDTLDLWFKEVDELSKSIEKFLKLTGIIKESVKVETSQNSIEGKQAKAVSNAEANISDISQIVSKVTEKFKGEITTLKETIEILQKELEEKDERIKDVFEQKPTKKIVPKKEIKLAPPKIKVPPIKRPEKPPHIKVKIESRKEEIEEVSKPIQGIHDDMPLEAKNGMVEEPLITEESLIKQIQSADSLDEPKLKPISEIPRMPSKTELPLKPPQFITEDEKIEKNGVKLTPLRAVKPKSMKTAEDNSELTPLPVSRPIKITVDESDVSKADGSQEAEIPFTLKSDLTPIPLEQTTITPEMDTQQIETPEMETQQITTLEMETQQIETLEMETQQIETPEIEPQEQPTFLTPIISKKPKISPISVEEIDTETIKSSGTDLFNVFSSVAKKSSDQEIDLPKTVLTEKPVEKTMNTRGITGITTPTMQSVPQTVQSEDNSIETETSFEELPKNKDTLYQELIALEGRRYSLEKNYKDMSNNYGSGIIDEFEFNNRSEGLKKQLDEISSRITKIRRIIASL